jgi:N-acyl-D-aspartate/D-glutamate deacylase
MLARVEGMPEEALKASIPWTWTTFAEYLGELVGRPSINVGFMVGHSAIRRMVMGDAATQRSATPAEVTKMEELLADGLSAGGLGFSSSYGGAHYDHTGVPVPSRHASMTELLGLASVCARFPGTSLAFIPEGTTSDTLRDDEVDLMAQMSSAAHRPLNWNVLSFREKADALARLRAGDYANVHGGKVVALAMPPVAGATFFRFGGMTFDAIPGWASVMRLPVPERLRALEDPAQREQLANYIRDAGNFGQFFGAWGMRRIEETHTPTTKQYEGRVVADIAAEQGKDPFNALLDIACADRLETTFSAIRPPVTDRNWEDALSILRDSRVVMGGSDAGAHLDFVGSFNYPTVFLEAVRTRGGMTMEEAIRLMTRVPAELYGLRGRGELAIGGRADLVVFDEDSVGSEPITMRRDLPGCDEPRLFADSKGIEHVIVSGTCVVNRGLVTEARPGTVLRSGLDTRTVT